MTDRLPPELESMDALLKRALPKEPMEGLTPAQLAHLREKVGMKRRSKTWLWAAVITPVLAASAALFLYGHDAARESDSYMAADETKYAGIEEDAAPEDVVAEAASDEEAEGKPATKVAEAKKPPAKVAQTRRQKPKNEVDGGSASLKGMKVGQGKPTTGYLAGPAGAKADAAANKTSKPKAQPTPPAAKDAAAAPAQAAPAMPSGGLGLAKAKSQGSLGKFGELGGAEKQEKKKKGSMSVASGASTATSPVVAGVTVTGALGRDIVTRLVRAADPKLRACFATYRNRAGAGAVGKASLYFTVTPDGKVTAASAVVTDNAFRACLKNEAGRWTFPAAKQKSKVSVRLSFKP